MISRLDMRDSQISDLEQLTLPALCAAIEMIAEAMKKNDVCHLKIGEFEIHVDTESC